LASLKQWTEKNFRGIWFKVTLEYADWVPVLAKPVSVFLGTSEWVPVSSCKAWLFDDVLLAASC